ncbi:MAG: hypothetical protein ACO3FH_07920 [Steroidobacteraceae bacterium]
MRYSIVMRSAVLSLACLLSPLNVAAQPVSSVIPPEVYRAAGLDKLTEAERKALIDWINAGAPMTASEFPSAPTVQVGPRAPTVAASPAPAVSPAPTSSPASAASLPPAPLPAPLTPLSEESEINTRILPPFTGWTGRTVFTMENGQVWQQRMDGSYTFKGTDTRVVITRGAFGLDRMRLVEGGRWIGVKRIK